MASHQYVCTHVQLIVFFTENPLSQNGHLNDFKSLDSVSESSILVIMSNFCWTDNNCTKKIIYKKHIDFFSRKIYPWATKLNLNNSLMKHEMTIEETTLWKILIPHPSN